MTELRVENSSSGLIVYSLIRRHIQNTREGEMYLWYNSKNTACKMHMSSTVKTGWGVLFHGQTYLPSISFLAGFTLTTFTSVVPTSLRRISTRRCRSRCSYSRGALRSSQCAPVCTIPLSTMPCQWVSPASCFCHEARWKPALNDQFISWWEWRK